MRKLTVPLVSAGGAARSDLRNIKYAFFDQALPNNLAAPTAAGGAIGLGAVTDTAGNIKIPLPNTTLAAGQTGFLILSDTDGTIGTASKAFAGPVGGAADFSALPEAGPQALPAAFVVPLEERAGSNQLDTGISQRVDVRFGVILAVRNLRDGVGGAANDDLNALRRAIKDALLGWQPAGTDDVCTFGGGRVLQLANQVLWWQDDFLTAYYERKV